MHGVRGAVLVARLMDRVRMAWRWRRALQRRLIFSVIVGLGPWSVEIAAHPLSWVAPRAWSVGQGIWHASAGPFTLEACDYRWV